MGTLRLHLGLAALAFATIGPFMTSPANAATVEEQLKELQDQVGLLEQQIKLTNLQQTQSSATQIAVLNSLKAQASAQSDLEKALAQGDFAKLAGIKAGMDSVGAPLGKEGAITVTTGTAGALMLSLRRPMLDGLETSASDISTSVGGRSIYFGSDAQVQSALQSETTTTAISQALTALDTSIAETAGSNASTASFTAAATVGLVLNTLVGLEKFFRVDTSYAVFDAGDDAQQALMSMLQQKLTSRKANYVNLSDISISEVKGKADTAQNALAALTGRQSLASAIATAIDKLKADDKSRPSQDKIDRLKSNITIANNLIESLHPAKSPEKFWAYVQGSAIHARMLDGANYRDRLVVLAKAQTIQVIEKRTWRSDKIYGKSDIQVEHRLLDASGKLLNSSLTLMTFKGDKDQGPSILFQFPEPPGQSSGPNGKNVATNP